MPADAFANFTPSLNDPARSAFAITPNDAATLPVVPRAIYVGTGGTLTLRALDSSGDVMFKNVVAGQVLDVRASHVRATGTTAADLIGLA